MLLLAVVIFLEHKHICYLAGSKTSKANFSFKETTDHRQFHEVSGFVCDSDEKHDAYNRPSSSSKHIWNVDL